MSALDIYLMWAQDIFTRLATLSFVAWCLMVLLEIWRTSAAPKQDEPSDQSHGAADRRRSGSIGRLARRSLRGCVRDAVVGGTRFRH